VIYSVPQAYRFCTEILDALEKMPAPHSDFVSCSLPRITSVRNELWPLKLVVERHVATIHSVAAGIQARLDSGELEEGLMDEEAYG